jgi:hypothetical protein
MILFRLTATVFHFYTKGRHYINYNDIQPNDNEHFYIKKSQAQHKIKLRMVILSVIIDKCCKKACYAERQ